MTTCHPICSEAIQAKCKKLWCTVNYDIFLSKRDINFLSGLSNSYSSVRADHTCISELWSPMILSPAHCFFLSIILDLCRPARPRKSCSFSFALISWEHFSSLKLICVKKEALRDTASIHFILLWQENRKIFFQDILLKLLELPCSSRA